MDHPRTIGVTEQLLLYPFRSLQIFWSATYFYFDLLMTKLTEQIPMQPVRCYLTFRHQRTNSYAACPMLPHLQTSKNKFLCNLSDVTSPSDIKEQIPMQPV